MTPDDPDLSELRAALDAATPRPDPSLRAAHLRLAQENFRLQGVAPASEGLLLRGRRRLRTRASARSAWRSGARYALQRHDGLQCTVLRAVPAVVRGERRCEHGRVRTAAREEAEARDAVVPPVLAVR